MDNEFEYDYWGLPITTHTQEECISVMKEVTAKENHIGVNGDYHNFLSEEDMELLIEYAPKLFDTLPQDNDLFTAMVGLKIIIGKHRFEVMWKRNEKARMSNSYSHNNKSQEEKADALKKHIDAIRGIIGMDSYIPKDHDLAELRTTKDDFLDELERTYQDPTQYLPHGDPGYCLEHNEHGETIKVLHHTQQPMEEYLKALQLKNRSDIIKEFIQKIADQNWFSFFYAKQQRPTNL